MDNTVLEKIAHFCDSAIFLDQLRRFRRQPSNLAPFIECNGDDNDALSGKEGGEEPLERMEVFLEHRALVDRLLTGFADDEGVPAGSLLEGLRDAIKGNFTPLFEEHAYLWLAELLLSWGDYLSFCALMKEEAKDVTSKLQSTSHQGRK